MGGDTNSGIMSGFEREKFFDGTNVKGYTGSGTGFDNIRRAIDVKFPESSEDVQPLADLITAANDRDWETQT